MRLQIDEVRIQAGDETVVISRADREELLARLRAVGGAAGLVERFETGGQSVPVKLGPDDAVVLVAVLSAWLMSGAGVSDGIRSLAMMVRRAT